MMHFPYIFNRNTVLQDDKFAALKEREYFWKFSNFKPFWPLLLEKMSKIFSKLVILVAKIIKILRKFKAQYQIDNLVALCIVNILYGYPHTHKGSRNKFYEIYAFLQISL